MQEVALVAKQPGITGHSCKPWEGTFFPVWNTWLKETEIELINMDSGAIFRLDDHSWQVAFVGAMPGLVARMRLERVLLATTVGAQQHQLLVYCQRIIEFMERYQAEVSVPLIGQFFCHIFPS